MKKHILLNNEILVNKSGQITYKKRFVSIFVLKFYRFILSGL